MPEFMNDKKGKTKMKRSEETQLDKTYMNLFKGYKITLPEPPNGHSHDIQLSMKVAEFTANLLLFMQSCPQYVEKQMRKIRAGSKKNRTPVESLVITAPSHMRLLQDVPLDPSGNQKYDTPSTGSKKHTHWRRSYWRRQVHGMQWELDNPDAKCGTFPDGRKYHMRKIPRTQINNPFEEDA